MRSWLRLTGRLLPWQLALLCVLLTLPALWVGWQLDDHFQRLVLAGSAEGHTGPLGLFGAFRDAELNRQWVEQGVLPWWTSESFRLSFFRPLSVASAWLDHRLWPGSPVAMHAHSLAWLALLVAAVTVAYRRLMGVTWTAGMAALLYAIDDANAVPAAWLANRAALLGALFGVLCVAEHHRWRACGSRLAAWTAPLCLALGLLAGETAVAAWGYLAAHAIFLERSGRRVRSLLPCGLVTSVWATAYVALGFGARGSGLYVDPLRDPVGFAGAVVERAPYLLTGQWWALPADLANLRSLSAPLWWAALSLCALVAVGLAPLLRRDRTARFWCAGMLLALLPACSGMPGNRMLLLVGFGAMGLLAQFFRRFTEKTGRSLLRPGWSPAGLLVLAWVLVHLVIAPLAKPTAACAVRLLGQASSAAARLLPSGPGIAAQDLVVVHAPDYLLHVSQLASVRAAEGRPIPRRLRALFTGPVEVELRRRDERTLVLRSAKGLLAGSLGRLFRDEAIPLGRQFELDDVTIEITELTRDGRPAEIVARFSTRLEHPTRRWVTWRDGAFLPFTPPPGGRSVTLPAVRDLFDPRRYFDLRECLPECFGDECVSGTCSERRKRGHLCAF